MEPLDQDLKERLRCPACRGRLAWADEGARASCEGCGAAFPVARGAPVLIDEKRSLFKIAEVVASSEQQARPRAAWKAALNRAIEKVIPLSGENLSGIEMLGLLAERLREESKRPRVLIIGGASLGVGVDAFLSDPAFTVVESDVVLGARTNLVSDAQAIPFEDGTFDAVVAQAVLEYVLDPFLVAGEIHRVLRPRGYVYAESPFMQQVHGGPYDFFRFSHVGHRWVFRKFEEVESGVACGPAMALQWSYRYFLNQFARPGPARSITNIVARATSQWLTPLDRPRRDVRDAYDAASAYYFLGRRSERSITHEELLASYRGAFRLHA